jgi:hypothetical protein
MILLLKKDKTHLLVLMISLLFSSCKQDEFYEKDKAAIANSEAVTPSSLILKDQVDSFKQGSSETLPVDILWMIDNSGSMANNQTALARNLNIFINQFLDKKIDFKMAITTTDARVNFNGRMIGDSSLLTSEAAAKDKTAFINNFMKMVKVGTEGSGTEEGLETSTAFLERYSSTFLRKNAYLVIMYISDEQDQSPKDVKNYLEHLQSFKANKGLVKAYSIVAQPKAHMTQYDSAGTRYNEVALATGGITCDITEDFSTTMRELGKNIVNLTNRFALSEIPYENKIQVFVNNTEVSAGWTFDESSHSLKFELDSLPEEGAKIEVRYKVKS